MIGRDSSRWHRGIPIFASVSYRQVYPGIDLVYHGSDQQRLEYDFVVAPKADPSSIRMDIAGADKLSVNAAGDLVIALNGADLTEHRPVAYQTMNGQRHPVAASYDLHGGEVGIRLGSYDRAQPLVIDPTITYASYLGGSQNDIATGVFQDSSGNIFLGGSTASPNFPTSSGAFQTSLSGTQDAFVTKIAPNGTDLVFSTYLGGDNSTSGVSMVVDQNDIPTIVGTTSSPDFPVVNGFQVSLNGESDGFVSQFNPDTGADLLFSTYIGGSGTDCVNSVTINSAGNLLLGGVTSSDDFPVTEGAFQTTYGGGATDGFFSVITSGTFSLDISTYLGGNNADAVNGIAVDSQNNAYLTGNTGSNNFPTTSGVFQASLKGTENAFVTKTNGQTLTYSTFLGGSSADFGTSIAVPVDTPFEAAVTGGTSSADFPTTTNATQKSFGGVQDAFVTQISEDGTGLEFSTYLGGSQSDAGASVKYVTQFDAAVVGNTQSSDFPLKSSIQGSFSGSQDAFLTDFHLSESKVVSSSVFGGNQATAGTSLFITTGGSGALFAGFTTSDNLQVTSNAFQKTLAGGSDAFVVGVKFSSSEQQQQSKKGPNLTTTTIGLGLIAIWITAVMIRRYRFEA